MNCKEVASKLQLFIDEELTYNEMEAVSTHLNLCTACESRFESEKMFKSTLREKIAKRPLMHGILDDVKIMVSKRVG